MIIKNNTTKHLHLSCARPMIELFIIATLLLVVRNNTQPTMLWFNSKNVLGVGQIQRMLLYISFLR
jgi:hypothetical protein